MPFAPPPEGGSGVEALLRTDKERREGGKSLLAVIVSAKLEQVGACGLWCRRVDWTLRKRGQV